MLKLIEIWSPRQERTIDFLVAINRAIQEEVLENVLRNNPDFKRDHEQQKKEQEASTFSDLVSFSKKLQTGAFEQQEVPKKQLTEAQRTNLLLEKIFGQGKVAKPAVAGP